LYIKFPLHYYQLVTRRRVLLVTTLSWLLLISIGLAVYTQLSIRHPCNAVQISPLIYLSICVLYVLMIVGSFVISAVIYCIAQNSRRIEPQARSVRSHQPRFEMITEVQSNFFQRIFQRLFFVFSSTLWTFVTCLPYRLVAN